MEESGEATKFLTAGCYCKAVQYSVDIPIAELPLSVHLCHCSICRYTHGMLCVFHAPLPKGVVPKFIAPSSMSNLTGYKHANAQGERFFCSTCGGHIGDRGLKESNNEIVEPNDQWVVATSLFSEHGEDIFKIESHWFTEGSTGGKGMFSWLPKMGDREMKFHNPDADDGSDGYGTKDEPPKQEYDQEGNEVLRAECHCGGVSFTFPRPTMPSVKNDPYLSKWASPKDSHKWIACLDLCDDCRLTSGTHVVGWTFIPRALVQPPMPVNLEPYGTMKSYVSSKGVLRGFCGKCGATVIFACDNRTPSPEKQIIDISIGVLRVPEGVLAEDWLTWRTGRVGWLVSGGKFDPVFAKSLADGMREWALNTSGEAVDFYIE